MQIKIFKDGKCLGISELQKDEESGEYPEKFLIFFQEEEKAFGKVERFKILEGGKNEGNKRRFNAKGW